ncbi:hypothetical protein HN954_03935 [bacterium]|nr:hypothetical protein [bacterium]MBT6831726.1 hypothetical protein [bacterium]MBT6996549.1 hypothetical protein [bacterium]MBT7772875.1 hypothetical protein [bacterium]
MTDKKTTPKPASSPKKTTPKKAPIAATKAEFSAEIQALTRALESTGLDDFMSLLRNPRKLLFWNFGLGVVRGLGVVIGMTVVVASIVWILTQLVDFPLIGQYFEELLNLLKSSAPQSMIPSLG